MDATDLWLSLGIYSLKFHEARDITEALPSGRLSARNQNIMVKWQTQLCHHEFLSIKHWRSDFWSCEMVTWRVIPITHKSSNYLFFCLKTRRHQEETSQWPFAGKICLLKKKTNKQTNSPTLIFSGYFTYLTPYSVTWYSLIQRPLLLIKNNCLLSDPSVFETRLCPHSLIFHFLLCKWPLFFYHQPGNCRANIFKWEKQNAKHVLKLTCQEAVASIWLPLEPGTACQIPCLNYVSHLKNPLKT